MGPVRRDSSLQLVPNWKRHDDAGDHAEPEGDGEDLQPEIRQAPIDRLAGDQAAAFEERKPGGQADGEGREDDVENEIVKANWMRDSNSGVRSMARFPA